MNIVERMDWIQIEIINEPFQIAFLILSLVVSLIIRFSYKMH
jgi:hypothetical protein